MPMHWGCVVSVPNYFGLSVTLILQTNIIYLS